MILLKELTNRVYSDNKCVSFDYTCVDQSKSNTTNDKMICFIARFKQDESNSLVWNMQIVLDRTRDADSQVYNFTYQLPKHGIDLTLICAIGLKYFQLHIKEEIQMKSDFDFILGDIINGVIG